jgi:hypothetical protein
MYREIGKHEISHGTAGFLYAILMLEKELSNRPDHKKINTVIEGIRDTIYDTALHIFDSILIKDDEEKVIYVGNRTGNFTITKIIKRSNVTSVESKTQSSRKPKLKLLM